MKIQVASDLHLEILSSRFPGYRVVEQTDADVLVLAGDIHSQDQAVAAFADWPVPVVLLNGNHEFYGASPERATVSLQLAAGRSANIHYLENQAWALGNVRFLGCCLWTDYELYGAADEAMEVAQRLLMDHSRIRVDDHMPFLPRHAREIHRASLEWLRVQLAIPHSGKTVVCTHHGPSAQSTHARFVDNPLNPCFMSNLDDLMQHADLWIHGHVHNSFDYHAGRARVVVNPRGYPLNFRQAANVGDLRWENPGFNAGLVVEV